MPTVWFVDTSILCNILPVPGKDQDRELVKAQMSAKQKAGDTFILPLTAVIETGNHISQLSNGYDRRRTAQIFQQVLTFVLRGQAPWQLHVFSWDENFLGKLIDGAETGSSLVEHAMSGVGCGDLCVLTERSIYRSRTGLDDVQIWTLDHDLHAHN